jgi:regulator of protease activity HflC (stomatin/prohibitin superfamily)
MGGIILALLVILAVLVITTLAKTIKIIPQARVGIVERFGKFQSKRDPGLNAVIPFVDKVRYMIDMREQVVAFAPQPVITEDNLTVSIDTVIYFQVNDPVAATYEIANYIQAVEQLTMTTLRNIVGGMTLEETLTSREQINSGLSIVLDEATGRWGIKVKRVEIKSIDPPMSIKDAMEKQMRADRDKRAAILTAEGQRQSAILSAEGNKQSAILNAEGQRESQILAAQADREAAILRAQGEGQAIQTLLAGDANKVWIVPSEIGKALEGLGSTMNSLQGIPDEVEGPVKRVDMGSAEPTLDLEQSSAAAAVQEALAEAKQAEAPNRPQAPQPPAEPTD